MSDKSSKEQSAQEETSATLLTYTLPELGVTVKAANATEAAEKAQKLKEKK